MSTCIDVVTPFDFDAPASVPAGAQKFSLFKSLRASTRASSSLVDRLPLRGSLHNPLMNDDNDNDAPRAVSTDDIEPSYTRLRPTANVVSVTAEYVQSDSKRSAGKPSRIKIIDWKSASDERQNDLENTLCHDLPYPSVDRELRASGMQHTERAQKRKQSPVDDDGDDTHAARHARNRRLFRAAAYNDDAADPLAGFDEMSQLEEDVARIIGQMEDF